jgi:CDP-diacylglycerol pyrophosphatase
MCSALAPAGSISTLEPLGASVDLHTTSYSYYVLWYVHSNYQRIDPLPTGPQQYSLARVSSTELDRGSPPEDLDSNVGRDHDGTESYALAQIIDDLAD